MLVSYLDIYFNALDNYISQKRRPGYAPGLFTHLRHSFYEYPALIDFRKILQKAKSKEEQKNTITAFLTNLNVEGKINNHSFTAYLIDELVRSDPESNWEKLYPKPIVFYQGILYRGTLQKPEDAFANGMTSSVSKKIEAYCNDTNCSTGVSTSTEKSIAQKYKTSVFQTAYGAHYEHGYLYKINYRGHGGVDIIETLKARGQNCRAAIAAHKQEVNIVGTVKPEDIVGCWGPDDKWIPNPVYSEKTTINPAPNSLMEHLADLFPVAEIVKSNRLCF